MAEPAQNLPASSAARKMRDASPVRVVGNLPNSQAANDNDRAREFIRERQGRVLPTLNMAPANDNASEDEESDVYGAGQRESEARMRTINQGAQDEGYGDEAQSQDSDLEETPDITESVQNATDDGYDQETQNALDLQRQRAIEEAEARNVASESEEADEGETEQQTKVAEQMAKKKAKSMLKAEIGSTGVGLIIVWLWWNYEVIIEGNQPTWKILLVLLLDLLLIALAIAPWVLLIVTLSAVASAVTSVLPDSIIQLLR